MTKVFEFDLLEHRGSSRVSSLDNVSVGGSAVDARLAWRSSRWYVDVESMSTSRSRAAAGEVRRDERPISVVSRSERVNQRPSWTASGSGATRWTRSSASALRGGGGGGVFGSASSSRSCAAAHLASATGGDWQSSSLASALASALAS